MNEATTAKMIASASGRNRYPATPESWNSGSQTMQMHRGRYESRHHDLVGALDDAGLEIGAAFKVAVDVLDDDGGVVHQDADGECQAPQRHDVDGLAEPGQNEHGGQDRERDRGHHDQGRAPAAKEQQHDQAGEERCGDHFLHHVVHRGAHEAGCVVDRDDGGSGRQSAQDFRKHLLDALYHRERRGVAVLEDLDQHGLLAMHQHLVDLRRRAAMHVGDVAQGDDCATHSLDRQVVEGGDLDRTGIGPDHVVERANLLIAGRQHHILRAQRVRHIHRRKPVRQQLSLIEVDLDVQRSATIRGRDGHAGHCHQRRADQVRRHVIDLGCGHPGSCHLQVQHRHRGRIVGEHLRRRDAGRHLLEHRLRDRGDLRLRRGHVGPWLEEDLHHTAAVIRLALDMLDVADRGRQRALVIVDHAARHVLWRQAVIGPDHGHHRDADVGEDVCRGPQYREDAEQHDQHAHDDEGQGAPQCDQHDSIHSVRTIETPSFVGSEGRSGSAEGRQ